MDKIRIDDTKEDCAACVDKYIDFCTDPHAEY